MSKIMIFKIKKFLKLFKKTIKKITNKECLKIHHNKIQQIRILKRKCQKYHKKLTKFLKALKRCNLKGKYQHFNQNKF